MEVVADEDYEEAVDLPREMHCHLHDSDDIDVGEDVDDDVDQYIDEDDSQTDSSQVSFARLQGSYMITRNVVCGVRDKCQV